MYKNFRIQQVQDPVIPIIGDMVRGHPGTISLGQGVVHYGPPAQALEAIQDFFSNAENHKYHAVEGIPLLQERLRAKLRQENGIVVDAQNNDPDASRLCVTAGGNMAFQNAVLAITDPGDEVILLSPFYFNHEMAVQIAGCTPVAVATDENYQPVIEEITAAITHKTRAIVTVSPNNPSGAVYTASMLTEINALCKTRNIYHINDEAYEYFTYQDARHFSPGSLDGASGHTISLFSLSKTYGFASWRIGYMTFPAHLKMAVKKIQDTNLICPPLISQFAAAGALQAGGAYCQKRLPEYAQVRQGLIDALQEIDDICYVPQALGAFYFFLKIQTTQDEMTLAKRLIQEFGVAVMPGKAFGMKNGCYFRVAYGALHQDSAEEGISRLIAGLKALTG